MYQVKCKISYLASILILLSFLFSDAWWLFKRSSCCVSLSSTTSSDIITIFCSCILHHLMSTLFMNYTIKMYFYTTTIFTFDHQKTSNHSCHLNLIINPVFHLQCHLQTFFQPAACTMIYLAKFYILLNALKFSWITDSKPLPNV